MERIKGILVEKVLELEVELEEKAREVKVFKEKLANAEAEIDLLGFELSETREELKKWIEKQ